MKSLKSIVLVVIILVFASCKNDDDLSTTPQNQDPDPTAFAQNFGNEITRTFLGTVVDTNNNPIENVSISIGSATAMTDNNGVFIISDATVNQRFGYVKAEKAGYIHASRAVVPSVGTNKVRIMMLPETVAGSTSSGTQETITLGNGASVALEGDYIKPDGTAYSGNVNVIMHHLDPANETMQDQMPGMLYAANALNEERMLQTFGMLAVELRGDNGEDLNLAEGSTAEITVPLDASLSADAPATIPLWYFDETHGYWVEDGQATLIGSNYVGTVSHFSFWNCDIPAEAVNFCATVTDESGNGLANLLITITSDTYGTTNGYTNESGKVCGLVPSNEILEINVYSYDNCLLYSIYTDTIGPFVSDSNITITIASIPELIAETVTGILNDCGGNPVTNGYVNLRYGNESFVYIVENGTFEFNMLRCENDDTFSIYGIDYNNLQETDSINYTFTTPLTSIGSISVCNAIDEFVQYTIDIDDNLIIGDFDVTFLDYDPNYDAPNLTITLTQGNNCFYLMGVLNETPYIGEYDYFEFTDVPPYDTGFNISECTEISQYNNGIVFNFNTLGQIGEYIDINFSGNYEDYDGSAHYIEGVIHVLRDY